MRNPNLVGALLSQNLNVDRGWLAKLNPSKPQTDNYRLSMAASIGKYKTWLIEYHLCFILLNNTKFYKINFFQEVLGVDFSNENRNLQIANYLQTLRLEQDLTLEQLSHLSQVPIVHLTSIEEGRFSRFDDFYLKMYLRRYTQSLGVDLEQLYIYASQQPLPEETESLKRKQQQEAPKLTQTQADISAVSKNVERKKPQRKKPTVKTANIARLEAKRKIGKFMIGLTFLLLIGVIVFFIVTIIGELGNHEPTQTDYPLVVDNPHDIDPNPTDEPAESDDTETDEPEPEPEPEPEDFTSIELDDHTGRTQVFVVTTELDEVELRIEHSGANWIGGFFNGSSVINNTYTDTLNQTFTLDGSDTLNLNVGAMNNITGMYINDVEVPFSADSTGQQNFNFIIESD